MNRSPCNPCQVFLGLWFAVLSACGPTSEPAVDKPLPLPSPIAAANGPDHAGVASAMRPARTCIEPSPVELRALRQNELRLVLVVKAFAPPKGKTGGLVVSFVSDKQTLRHELTRLAVHPLRAFTALQTQNSQRFLISLEPVAHLLEDGQALCLEVAFVAGSSALDGRAEVELVLSPPLANPPPQRP